MFLKAFLLLSFCIANIKQIDKNQQDVDFLCNLISPYASAFLAILCSLSWLVLSIALSSSLKVFPFLWCELDQLRNWRRTFMAQKQTLFRQIKDSPHLTKYLLHIMKPEAAFAMIWWEAWDSHFFLFCVIKYFVILVHFLLLGTMICVFPSFRIYWFSHYALF